MTYRRDFLCVCVCVFVTVAVALDYSFRMTVHRGRGDALAGTCHRNLRDPVTNPEQEAERAN